VGRRASHHEFALIGIEVRERALDHFSTDPAGEAGLKLLDGHVGEFHRVFFSVEHALVGYGHMSGVDTKMGALESFF
jgi:hypothetical protein